jgi:class 3 adenylate cyclase/CheY-like chemotaxis protein
MWVVPPKRVRAHAKLCVDGGDMADSNLTFLFTDIEGSTRLVREHGDRYADILRDTRDLIGAAVEEAGGRIVHSRADELFAVFDCPKRAVSAALAAQRALGAHPWPAGEQVCVRMGLHTGTAAEDPLRDYVGLDVHRAARIASAGHGGQILCSAATATELEAPVRDLGDYELAGLALPERIFQVLADDLPADFPALRCRAGRPEDRVRVAIADDSALIREGIARVLEHAGMDVVAQAGTADELLHAVETIETDVAVVDIRMPPGGTDEGLRAAQAIRRRFPGVGVLLLSQVLEPAYASELVAEGTEGVGYLLKDRISDVAEFAAAVELVAEGGHTLDPALLAAGLS